MLKFDLMMSNRLVLVTRLVTRGLRMGVLIVSGRLVTSLWLVHAAMIGVFSDLVIVCRVDLLVALYRIIFLLV